MICGWHKWNNARVLRSDPGVAYDPMAHSVPMGSWMPKRMKGG